MLKIRSRQQHTLDARLSLHHVMPHAAAVLTTAAAAAVAADTLETSLEHERERDQHFARHEGALAASLGCWSVPVEHELPTGMLHCEWHRYW
jgi:hypothetical protein